MTTKSTPVKWKILGTRRAIHASWCHTCSAESRQYDSNGRVVYNFAGGRVEEGMFEEIRLIRFSPHWATMTCSRYNGYENPKSTEFYKLWVPWIYLRLTHLSFVERCHNGHKLEDNAGVMNLKGVGCSSKKLRYGKGQTVYLPPLPNVESNFALCSNNVKIEKKDFSKLTDEELAQRAYQMFFGSSFNSDIFTQNFDRLLDFERDYQRERLGKYPSDSDLRIKSDKDGFDDICAADIFDYLSKLGRTQASQVWVSTDYTHSLDDLLDGKYYEI